MVVLSDREIEYREVWAQIMAAAVIANYSITGAARVASEGLEQYKQAFPDQEDESENELL